MTVMTRLRLVSRLLSVVLAAALVPVGTAAAAPASARTAKLYFTAGEQFSPVDRALPSANSGALSAVTALLRGPTAAELAKDITTQIPDGVTITSLTTDGKTAVLELSPRFLDGIGRSGKARTAAQRSELAARIGQVVFTLTQFPGIGAAKIRSGGLLLEAAVGRGDYAKPLTGPVRRQRPPGKALSGTKQVQQQLAAIGFLTPDAVDGLAGYRTQQAILAFQAWQGLGRDGVAGPLTTAKLAKAGRPQPRAGGPAHRIEVSRAKGVLLEIEGGQVVRAIHVSTGGPGTETPSGTFKIFRKELRSWSVPFSTWLPFASYFNNGIAFHEYPDVPAVPASHGCVRVPAPEAKGVYDFASQATTVVVL
jgi:lipoprotein-anchoring transpeptidase ErfK/SrfK